MTVLWVALGGMVGAPLRLLVSRWADRGHRLPWGTLVVNVAGSLALGVLAAGHPSPAVAALLGAGFCGALTTYSTFAYETWQLIDAGAAGRALANVALNLSLGLAACALGFGLGSL